MILKDQYIAGKACNTYITTVSQPESDFNLFFVAQMVNLKKNAKLLNNNLIDKSNMLIMAFFLYNSTLIA